MHSKFDWQVAALILENTFTSILDMAGVLLPFLKWFIGGSGCRGPRILNCFVRSPWNTIDVIGEVSSTLKPFHPVQMTNDGFRKSSYYMEFFYGGHRFGIDYPFYFCFKDSCFICAAFRSMFFGVEISVKFLLDF